MYSSDREEQEELISAFHILSVVKASSRLNYHIPYSTQLSLPVAATGPVWRVVLLSLCRCRRFSTRVREFVQTVGVEGWGVGEGGGGVFLFFFFLLATAFVCVRRIQNNRIWC